MSGTQLLLALIVALAFTVESAIGFGATVITVSLGALIVSLSTVLPAYIPVNMALSGYLVLRYRKDIAWGVLARRIAPFVAIGMPLGFWAGATVPERIGVKLFGAFVIVLASSEAISRVRAARAASVEEPSAESPAKTWARDVFAMTVCGVLFGMYGTGGPLAVWSVSHHARDPGVFRATLALLWFALNLIVHVRNVSTGHYDLRTLALTASFIPSLLIGTLLGERLHRSVPAKTFRTAVFSMLFLVGCVLVLRR